MTKAQIEKALKLATPAQLAAALAALPRRSQSTGRPKLIKFCSVCGTGPFGTRELRQHVQVEHDLPHRAADASTELAKQVAKYCFVCGSGPLDAPALQRHVRKHVAVTK